MATAAQAAEFRAANLALTARVEADVANFWRRLDLSNPARATNALVNYVPLLVQRYGDLAATIAADWFDALRMDAVDAGMVAAVGRAKTYEAIAADPVALAISRQAVASAAQWLKSETPEKALTAVTDVATGRVLGAGRDTIILNTRRDTSARGWQRLVRSGGCEFCQMLHSRGGVYTERSSHFAAHDHCNCVTAPVWDPSAPKVDVAAEFVASQRWGALRKAAANGDTEATKALATYRSQVRNYLARFDGEPADVYADEN